MTGSEATEAVEGVKWAMLAAGLFVVSVQVGLAAFALKMGFAIAKAKTTQEALPIITLVVAPAVTLIAGLTPAAVELFRRL